MQTVGNGTQTISGVAISVNADTALALARSFMLASPGAFLQTKRETQENVHSTDFTAGAGDGSGGGTTAAQHVKVDFSYGYFLPGPTAGAMRFSTRTNEDYATHDLTTDVSGTCYAETADAANTLIEAMWTAFLTVSGTRKVKKEKSVQQDQAGGVSIFLGTSFALALAATGGDLIEATCSVETTYSAQRTVMTPIPFGDPFVQSDLSTSPGSVTALTMATALAWGRGKYIGDGYPEPARETMHTKYHPLSGSVVRVYRMDFTYRSTYASLPFSVG